DQLKTQTKPIYVPPEAESRFDEGIPLMGACPQPTAEESRTKHPSMIGKAFDGGNDEGTDFFNSASENAFETQIPVIALKSTSQVFESLHFAQDSPAVETTSDSFCASDAKLTAETGDVGVSSEDLVARWQAELEKDDDFLEDEFMGPPLANQELYLENTSGGLGGSRSVIGNIQPSSQEL